MIVFLSKSCMGRLKKASFWVIFELDLERINRLCFQIKKKHL